MKVFPRHNAIVCELLAENVAAASFAERMAQLTRLHVCKDMIYDVLSLSLVLTQLPNGFFYLIFCLKTGEPTDPVLEIAARESGVTVSDIIENLPAELSVWVDPGEVSYRIGEKGAVKVSSVQMWCKSLKCPWKNFPLISDVFFSFFFLYFPKIDSLLGTEARLTWR